jgi:hypothetical protein
MPPEQWCPSGNVRKTASRFSVSRQLCDVTNTLVKKLLTILPSGYHPWCEVLLDHDYAKGLWFHGTAGLHVLIELRDLGINLHG